MSSFASQNGDRVRRDDDRIHRLRDCHRRSISHGIRLGVHERGSVSDGRHILSEVPISFSRAALGTELTVPTIDGDQTITVPPGTQSGARMRLKGKGAPALDGDVRGDQFVTLNVITPGRLSDEQRRLFEQLAELDGEETLEPGLFDRVKKIFGT